jgi:hypothetical protein
MPTTVRVHGDGLSDDVRDFLDASIRQDLNERNVAHQRARDRTVPSAVLAARRCLALSARPTPPAAICDVSAGG